MSHPERVCISCGKQTMSNRANAPAHRADWARATESSLTPFFVAHTLDELADKPFRLGETNARLYSKAITEVPPKDQRAVLDVSGLSEDFKSMVDQMAKTKKPITKTHVRTYSKMIADAMWRSAKFRKNLANYWRDEQLLAEAEKDCLDQYDIGSAKEENKKGLTVRINREKARLAHRARFCERRMEDAGVEDNCDVERSDSLSQLSDDDEEEEEPAAAVE